MTPCVHGVRYALPYRVDARDRGPQGSVVLDEDGDMEAVGADQSYPVGACFKKQRIRY